MRSMIAILVGLAAVVPACSKGENAGVEAARKQAAEEMKAKAANASDIKTIHPPVPGRAKLPCSEVLDPAKFGAAIGETEPVTIKDSTSEPDAAASCSVIRGGKRLSDAEQKAKLKKDGVLGVLAGDEICNVSTFCWTIEDPDSFKKRCAERKEQIDDSLGFPACILIVATGEYDVKRFRFYDDDTKCIIQVRGGPSNTDNDLIGKCAKAAHDQIGPGEIAVHAGDTTAPAGSAAPAGSGT